MAPRQAAAQTAAVRRFFGFFYPCGTDPRKWNPAAGALTATTVSECLQDLKGFAAEGIWPAETALLSDVTAVTGIDHSGVCVDIHMPSMALSAHKGTANNYTPPQPTLDQYLADQLQGTAPYRNLALSATPSTDIGQGNISFRARRPGLERHAQPARAVQHAVPGGQHHAGRRDRRGARAPPAEERARLRAGGRQPAERASWARATSSGSGSTCRRSPRWRSR